jgi:hypothetical protein
VLRDPFNVSARPAAIGRVVTATITLVCVLIVYDGWANLRARDVALIILGPVIAIFTSHVFSTTLVMQIELGRRPTRSEWLANVRAESRFLLLAVPPLAVLLLLTLANVSLQDAVRAVIWMETLSLAFWSGLAAWLGGLRGRPLVLAVLAGLVISGIVVALEVTLQPGKALNGGTAAGPTMQSVRGGRRVAVRRAVAGRGRLKAGILARLDLSRAHPGATPHPFMKRVGGPREEWD